jgi:hypothetical protein
MAEHSLQRFHVRSSANGKACGRVSKIVDTHSLGVESVIDPFALLVAAMGE